MNIDKVKHERQKLIEMIGRCSGCYECHDAQIRLKQINSILAFQEKSFGGHRS